MWTPGVARHSWNSDNIATTSSSTTCSATATTTPTRPVVDHFGDDVSLANISPRKPAAHLRRYDAEGHAAGTAWAEIAADWCCSDCGVREKVDFVPVEPERSSA
jgi:hypothetical protein